RDALARFAERLGVGLHRLIDIAALLAAFGGKTPAALAAHRDRGTVGALEGRDQQGGVIGKGLSPLVLRQMEAFGWRRLVRSGAEALLVEGLAAGAIEFLDLGAPRGRCLIGFE